MRTKNNKIKSHMFNDQLKMLEIQRENENLIMKIESIHSRQHVSLLELFYIYCMFIYINDWQFL